MKNLKIKLVLAAVFSVVSIAASAQKLPNVQKESVRAPVDIKIDGKATEWSDQFQAYNKSTELYYTLSNDENKLYLAIHVINPRVIQKAIENGISFTVETSTNKASVMFPLISMGDSQTILFNIQKKQKDSGDTVAMKRQTDSLVLLANKILTSKLKEIKTTGIKGIDNQISIYNDVGIKAACLFNNKRAYTYELALSLKLLGLSADVLNKFNYNIKVNGRMDRRGVLKSGTSVMYKFGSNGSVTESDQDLNNATDLSGKYTLAKK